MKTTKIFLTALIYGCIMFLVSELKAQQPIPLTFDYIPFNQFNGDTTEFIKKNFLNTMRYDGKKIEFFFNEFEKDIPIRSVLFMPATGENIIGYIFLFTQTKEQVIKEMREKGKAMGLITDVDRLFRKRLDPKGYQIIEDLGIGEILDMTDQIRAVLKDKPMSGINYGHKLILEKYK